LRRGSRATSTLLRGGVSETLEHAFDFVLQRILLHLVDLPHFVLFLLSLVPLLHFPLLFDDHGLDCRILSLFVGVLISLLRLLLIFFGQIFLVPVLGRPILDVEFVFLFELTVALTPHLVALIEDVGKDIFLLFLIGSTNLRLVVVNVVLNLLLLLLPILVSLIALLLLFLSCFFLFFLLFSELLFLIELLLHLSPPLEHSSLDGLLLLSLSADVQLAMLVAVMDRLLEHILCHCWLLYCLDVATASTA
jgi:hypothetical protein